MLIKDRHSFESIVDSIDRINDFRNIVAHDYFGVDAEEVWQIIKNDLPELRVSIHKILEEKD
jgi:uncharacterized protein with HEPN domain